MKLSSMVRACLRLLPATAVLALAAPAGSGMPIQLEDTDKKLFTDMINKVEAAQTGGNLSVSYRGDLKPVIEKAATMGMQFAGKMGGVPMMTPPAAKTPPAKKPAAKKKK